MIDRYAVADVSASGFNRVFTYKYKQESTVTTRNLDTYAANFLPVYYYNTTDKLQIRSNSNDKSIYDSTVNIATNAKSIAQLIIKHLNDGPTITRPY
jgi:hypothetical protein